MTKFGIAQNVRRVEDPRLLIGGGRYTDDIQLPGEAIATVLRSPHAAARIITMDADAARAMPGVLAVYTGADLQADGIGGIPCGVSIKNRDGSSRADVPHHALASGAVRHVGDPVAFIVAETHQAARDAAEAVFVEYDILPSVTDLGATLDAGSPAVWDSVPGNMAFDWEVGDRARVDSLFDSAAHVTRLTVVNNRIVVASLEARAATAQFEDGRFTLYTNTQGGWSIRGMLATLRVRIARKLPSASSASSPRVILSRPWLSDTKASLRSLVHLTGRPSLRAA